MSARKQCQQSRSNRCIGLLDELVVRIGDGNGASFGNGNDAQFSRDCAALCMSTRRHHNSRLQRHCTTVGQRDRVEARTVNLLLRGWELKLQKWD